MEHTRTGGFLIYAAAATVAFAVFAALPAYGQGTTDEAVPPARTAPKSDATRARLENARTELLERQRALEAARSAAKNERQEVRETAAEKREAVQGKRAETREAAAAKREELKKRLEERHKERVRLHIERVLERFRAAAERLEKLSERIGSRIEKLAEEGADVSALTRLHEAAQAKITEAKTAVEGIRTAADAAISAQETRENVIARINQAMRTAKDALKAAHAALVDVVNSLKPGRTAPRSPTATTTSGGQ